MRRHFLGLWILALSAIPSRAAEPVGIEAITPLVDDQTIAVTYVDLTRLDFAAVQEHWLEPLASTDLERKILKVVVDELRGWTKRHNVGQFYVVTTIGHLPLETIVGKREFVALGVAHSTFAVVPHATAASVAELNESIQRAAKTTWPDAGERQWPACRAMHGAAVVGMGTLLDELPAMKPAARPEFRKVLDGLADRPIRAAAVPPPVFARASREILPEPVPGGDTPLGVILARGALTGGATFDFKQAGLTGEGAIQSASPADAQSLSNLLHLAATLGVAKLAQISPRASLGAATTIQQLLPVVEGDRLVLRIDEPQSLEIKRVLKDVAAMATADFRRRGSMNQLKQLGLAMHNYHSVHKHFPDVAIRDKQEKPLLSWRVAILPYLDAALYKEFHLDEPWDSEHNRKLISRMPEVFGNPEAWKGHPGRTRYLAPVGEDLAFPPDRPTSIKDFTDGTAHTIMIVEADPEHAVIWTKPEDIEVDLESPIRGLAPPEGVFLTAFADGSARVLAGSIEPGTLRILFTRNDGQVVPKGY